MSSSDGLTHFVATGMVPEMGMVVLVDLTCDDPLPIKNGFTVTLSLETEEKKKIIPIANIT